MSKKKILVVLTSTEKYPKFDRATGIWLGEAVHFVEKLAEAGYEFDYVSPRGGYVPIDPHSLEDPTPSEWDWYANSEFRNNLGNSKRPEDVNAADYAAIYYVGGHGVVWDFPDNAPLQALSRDIYEAGGIVSSVCHGAVGLLNIRLSDGSLLIAGKEVTGFSDEEERLAGLDHMVPYLTETELRARGANYAKAERPWESFAVADHRVITGQNPASGGYVADLVLEHLNK